MLLYHISAEWQLKGDAGLAYVRYPLAGLSSPFIPSIPFIPWYTQSPLSDSREYLMTTGQGEDSPLRHHIVVDAKNDRFSVPAKNLARQVIWGLANDKE